MNTCDITHKTELNDVKTEFINGLYELGQYVAYRGFMCATQTSFNVYCERYFISSKFNNLNDVEIRELLNRGKDVYERGFNDFNGKTYLDEIVDIRKNHLCCEDI